MGILLKWSAITQQEVIQLIELVNISKAYRSGSVSVEAIRNINLTVNKGEIFGIIGHSGAGKSTLLRCVNLLERPTTGSVKVGGAELTTLSPGQLQNQRRRIGMIFQHFNLLSLATVRENIAFPLRLAKLGKKEINHRVDELLQLVGLTDHADKYPSQLSGGQKQRVGIARALANNPDVLLCDEATSALDPQTTNSILALLVDINQKLGITILLITHEMHVIRSICDRVAVIDQGEVVEMGEVLKVFLKPEHAVTLDFVSQVADSFDPRELVGVRKGKLVRLNYVGDLTYEPILYNAVKATSIQFTILQGIVSRMKGTPYGQLVIELIGSGSEVDKVIAVLRGEGLDVGELT
ncbi:methionine import ATP-binding protein MetN 2 [Paenibacillus baekrokdamisoli]|uniref:Methionine import ATP-binding protein MetN 2 n=1 Tax=Paenibacillus baekrokdamisoli TaxID=1712516 RepID=A0A3G9J8M4_9BACL|nr:D-methionine transport system ATP-binding protein [Paenibacillus baekrokdamisoli]BBH21213.1 methionine import ATP-binding protein MetN 2 [Paenibacillus baekrokdamisoli]